MTVSRGILLFFFFLFITLFKVELRVLYGKVQR